MSEPARSRVPGLLGAKPTPRSGRNNFTLEKLSPLCGAAESRRKRWARGRCIFNAPFSFFFFNSPSPRSDAPAGVVFRGECQGHGPRKNGEAFRAKNEKRHRLPVKLLWCQPLRSSVHKSFDTNRDKHSEAATDRHSYSMPQIYTINIYNKIIKKDSNYHRPISISISISLETAIYIYVLVYNLFSEDG